jgi:hypothetical protein
MSSTVIYLNIMLVTRMWYSSSVPMNFSAENWKHSMAYTDIQAL